MRKTCFVSVCLFAKLAWAPLALAEDHPERLRFLDLHRAGGKHHPHDATHRRQALARHRSANFMGERSHPRFRPAKFDVEHYDLKIAVDPHQGRIAGSVRVAFRSTVARLDSLVLDALDMRILGVRNAVGDKLDYYYDGQILSLALPSPLLEDERDAVVIEYEAPRPQGLFITGPDPTNPHRMVAAYTYTQPEDARTWFPCHDRPTDKATLDIAVQVPPDFKALSNGHFFAEDREDAGATFYRYRMEQPLATYLVSLVVGPYQIHHFDAFKGKPVTVWTPEAIAPQVLAETWRTTRMIEVFSDWTGLDYPYGSYAQAIAEAYHDSMEHQSASSLASFRMTGDGSAEPLVAHELAHQWFGDWVTCSSWGDLWLNEGFATYLQLVWFESQKESNRALGQVASWREAYFKEAQKRAHPLSDIDPPLSDMFDAHAYEKGALVLRLMRRVAADMALGGEEGRDPWLKAVRRYLYQHGTKNVATSDLQNAIESVTRQSWQMFFDQWVRSSGHPVLDVQYRVDGQDLVVRVEQTQHTRTERRWRAFSFPLPIDLYLAGGEQVSKVLGVYDAVQEFRLPLGGASFAALAVDPEWLVPAEWQLRQDAPSWKTVFVHARTPTAKLDAARQLIHLQGGTLTAAQGRWIARSGEPFVLMGVMETLGANPKNAPLIAELYEALAHAPDADVVIEGALARTRLWLVKVEERGATPDEMRLWQENYRHSKLFAEREALASLMFAKDSEAAQSFALARFKEASWTSADRALLVDLLTKTSSPETERFIYELIERGSWFYTLTSLNNLRALGRDNMDLVDGLVSRATHDRHISMRLSALGLLAHQHRSKEKLCPELKKLADELALAQPQELFAKLAKASAEARVDLQCEP